MTSRISLTFMLMIALILGACAEISGGPKTPQELALESQVADLKQTSRNIVARNALQGAAAGAGIGCIGGFLLGGGAEDCVKGALGGAVVGGATGAAVGSAAAKSNETQVLQQQTMANLRSVNNQLSSVQANLRSVVKAQDAELRSLRTQLKNQQVSQQTYDRRIAAINSNRTNVRDGLAQAESDVNRQRQDLTKLNANVSANEAAQTERRIAAIRNSVELVPSN